MGLTYDHFKQILNIGISISADNDRNHILSSILENGLNITNCDAGTLYLYKEGQLVFKIMKTLSMGISKGEHGEEINMPPVALSEQNVCAYSAMHRIVVNITDVYDNIGFDFSGPKRYDRLTGYHTQSLLVIPLENNEGELIGVLQLINAKDEKGNVIPFDAEYEIVIRSLGSLAAIELTNLSYMEEIKEQMNSFVEAFATAVDERTPYNGMHTRKVAEYAVRLANYINLKYSMGECIESFDEKAIENLRLAALLHDIGKMVVPLTIMNRATRLDSDMALLEMRFELIKSKYKIDQLSGRISDEVCQKEVTYLKESLKFIHEIDRMGYLSDEVVKRVEEIAGHQYQNEDTCIPYLTKRELDCLSIRKGTLTKEDRKIMEGHAAMTEKILSKVHFNHNYKEVAHIAQSHHECLDGSGYPNQLTGEKLSIGARILAVVDIYDAMTSSDRPYKEPMAKEKAFHLLKELGKNGKIELRLVNWFEEVLSEG